jgi:Predicted transcriptional regulator
MADIDFKELTKAELELMHIVWDKKEAILSEIVDGYPLENRPAYTTISTIVRILVNKGFLKYKTYGKVHLYSAAISKDNYKKNFLNNTLSSLFNNSPVELVSYLSNQGTLSAAQYQELKDLIEKKIK